MDFELEIAAQQIKLEKLKAFGTSFDENLTKSEEKLRELLENKLALDRAYEERQNGPINFNNNDVRTVIVVNVENFWSNETSIKGKPFTIAGNTYVFKAQPEEIRTQYGHNQMIKVLLHRCKTSKIKGTLFKRSGSKVKLGINF